MPAYVPSKEEEFTELLDNLLLRLGAPVDGKNATIKSLNLPYKSILAVLSVLSRPYFLRLPLEQQDLDVLRDNGVTLDMLDDVHGPLVNFIEDIKDNKENKLLINRLYDIYENKADIINKQVRPNHPRLDHLGGKRRRVTRKHKVHRRKTRARRVCKVRKN